jgi:hypothetical protein
MADQFVVPQFLDVETKIIGPITARQFAILLMMVLVEFIIYRVFLSLWAILGIGIPVMGLAITFAFARVNGQPFHYIVLNIIQTLRKPGLRVWDKRISDKLLRISLKKEEKKAEIPPTHKPPISSSRLADMSLIVNTGGVYQPDEPLYGK